MRQNSWLTSSAKESGIQLKTLFDEERGGSKHRGETKGVFKAF